MPAGLKALAGLGESLASGRFPGRGGSPAEEVGTSVPVDKDLLASRSGSLLPDLSICTEHEP